MTEATFGAILDKPSSEVERPKPLPAGTYHCIITERPKYDKSTKKQTEFVEFTLHPLHAMEDVDEEALNTALTKVDGSVGVLKDKAIRATFYLTEEALYRLKDFLIDDCQIEEDDSFRTMIDATLNCEVLAKIKLVPNQDGTGFYTQLTSTAPVGE